MTAVDRSARLHAAVLGALTQGSGYAKGYGTAEDAADAIVAAVEAVLDEDETVAPIPYCCTEYGIFRDMRADGLGMAFLDTRASEAAARVCADGDSNAPGYPLLIRKRRVWHSEWEDVPDES